MFAQAIDASLARPVGDLGDARRGIAGMDETQGYSIEVIWPDGRMRQSGRVHTSLCGATCAALDLADRLGRRAAADGPAQTVRIVQAERVLLEVNVIAGGLTAARPAAIDE